MIRVPWAENSHKVADRSHSPHENYGGDRSPEDDSGRRQVNYGRREKFLLAYQVKYLQLLSDATNNYASTRAYQHFVEESP